MFRINKRVLSAGVGVLAGVIGGKVLTSKLAKKAAVATVQQGLKAKSAVDKTVENIKVTTDDIVAEAKVKNEIEIADDYDTRGYGGELELDSR